MDDGPEKLRASSDPSLSDARIRDAVENARKSIVRALIVATALIVAALAYTSWTDPYARCARLKPKVTAPNAAPTSEELQAWDLQECEDWPGI